MRHLITAVLLLAARRVESQAGGELDWSPLAATHPGAVCNDGTSAGYYYRAGANASSLWIVFLESGGWCYDQSSCANRSTDQTSSKTYPNTTSVGGLLNATDPRLAEANVAYVPYCTSDAYVGAAAGPIFDGSPTFAGGFAGAAVVRAVFDDLVETRGLGGGAAARTVLFAGFSAGGRGVMFNCDAVGARLAAALAPAPLQYACFMDSAVWLDVAPYRNTSLSAAARSAQAFALFNASATVAANSPACAAALGDWRCIFGEYAAPFVQTPRLFYNMYLYDSYQLNTIGGIGSGPPWGNPDKLAYAEAFRARMAATMAAIVPTGGGGGGARGRVSAACYSHGNTLTDKFEWQRVAGTTLALALGSWLYGDDTAPRTALDPTPGANENPFCSADVPVYSVAFNASAAPLAVVDDQFMGYNIDTGSLYHGLVWDDDAFVELAAALAPGQLRVGGGAADALLYEPNGPYGAGPNVFATGLNGQVTLLNASTWRAVAGFAAATGLALLWDANGFAFRRNVTWGAWNASGDVPWPQGRACPACIRDAPFDTANSNLTAMIVQAASEGLCLDALSVGNEPDLYYRYGLTLSGAQLARDMRAWTATVAAVLPGIRVAGPAWAGFNATDAAAFFAGMRGAGPYMATTHNYPIPNSQQGSGRTGCSVPSFVDMGRFVDAGRSSLASSVSGYVAALLASGAAAPPRPGSAADAAAGRDTTAPRFVLEETSSSALGGCANYSDRFVAGFYVLNALTTPYELGYAQVNYQDLVGWSFTARPSQYAALGPPGWVGGSAALRGAVKPPYWAMLLHRQIVGAVALPTTVAPGITDDTGFAAHVWCAGAAATSTGVPLGAVVIVFTNGRDSPVLLDPSLVGSGGTASLRRLEFVLTSPDTSESTETGLLGAAVLLNGAPLQLLANGSLPGRPFPGRPVADPIPLTVPAYSYGWIVLLDAGAPTCDAGAAVRAPLPGVRSCASPSGGGGSDDASGVSAAAVTAITLAAVASIGGAGAWLLTRWRAQRRADAAPGDEDGASSRLLSRRVA